MIEKFVQWPRNNCKRFLANHNNKWIKLLSQAVVYFAIISYMKSVKIWMHTLVNKAWFTYLENIYR